MKAKMDGCARPQSEWPPARPRKRPRESASVCTGSHAGPSAPHDPNRPAFKRPRPAEHALGEPEAREAPPGHRGRGRGVCRKRQRAGASGVRPAKLARRWTDVHETRERRRVPSPDGSTQALRAGFNPFHTSPESLCQPDQPPLLSGERLCLPPTASVHPFNVFLGTLHKERIERRQKRGRHYGGADGGADGGAEMDPGCARDDGDGLARSETPESTRMLRSLHEQRVERRRPKALETADHLSAPRLPSFVLRLPPSRGAELPSPVASRGSGAWGTMAGPRSVAPPISSPPPRRAPLRVRKRGFAMVSCSPVRGDSGRNGGPLSSPWAVSNKRARLMVVSPARN